MSTTVPTPTIPDDAVEAPVGRRPPPGIGVAGRLRRVLLPLLSLLVFLAAWQLAAASGVWNETFVPYPSTVWRAFLDASSTHDGVRGYQGYLLWEHLYMTLRRVLAGVVVGVAIGVVVGLLMGTVGWVRRVLEPWLTLLRALPPLAYFFLLAIWLGIDEAPKVTLLAASVRTAGSTRSSRNTRTSSSEARWKARSLSCRPAYCSCQSCSRSYAAVRSTARRSAYSCSERRRPVWFTTISPLDGLNRQPWEKRDDSTLPMNTDAVSAPRHVLDRNTV